MRPEGPTRGSGVSSWPGPMMPASPGCRLHRWTSPNTSRPWWGSRSFHGAAGGARPAPRVTSGGQKTGFANRGLHVWTTGESTWSAALGGRDCRISEGGGPKMPGALNRILEGLIPGIPAAWVQSSVGSGMRMTWTSRWLMPGSSWAPMAKGVTVWPVALASSAARWAARSTSCCWMVMEISARM